MSKQLIEKQARHARRKTRIRGRVEGTAERPRLNVFRSLTNIYAQVIDDSAGNTLVSASTIDGEVKAQLEGKSKTEAAKIVVRSWRSAPKTPASARLSLTAVATGIMVVWRRLLKALARAVWISSEEYEWQIQSNPAT